MIEVDLGGYDLTKLLLGRADWTLGVVGDWTGWKLPSAKLVFGRRLIDWGVPIGSAIQLAEDGTTVATLTVTDAREAGAGYELTCQPAIAGHLAQVGIVAALNTTPAGAALTLLTGKADTASFAGAGAMQMPIDIDYSAKDSQTVTTIIGRLLQLATAEISLRADGLLEWMEYRTWNPGYTLKLASRLEQESAGTREGETGYSLGHRYDAELPATGGTTDRQWSDDFGPRSSVVVRDSAGAHFYGGRRIARAGLIRYKATVTRRQYVQPGECYLIDGAPYRMVTARFDGSGFAQVSLEEVRNVG